MICDGDVNRVENFHRINIENSDWIIPNRYTKLARLGDGAFGAVCSAFDSTTQSRVAIKKLYLPFYTPEHAKRTLREMRLLKHFSFENVISMLDTFSPDQSLEGFRDVYFVTQYMEMDLQKVIAKCSLEDSHVKYITLQILRALKYIHSAGVIHRDLTPKNIAINLAETEIRILDFGLAREKGEQMTGYVTTRWYRAPEIMLNWCHYSNSVDIWSCGCIMAELFIRKPLFPGNCAVSLLRRIMEVCGTPTSDFMNRIESTDAKSFIEQEPHCRNRKLSDEFPEISPLASDLIHKMLEWDPSIRITADEALKHPYLEEFWDTTDVPTVAPFANHVGEDNISLQNLKKLVWDLL